MELEKKHYFRSLRWLGLYETLIKHFKDSDAQFKKINKWNPSKSKSNSFERNRKFAETFMQSARPYLFSV